MTRTTINPSVRYRNAKPATKLAEQLIIWLQHGGMVAVPTTR